MPTLLCYLLRILQNAKLVQQLIHLFFVVLFCHQINTNCIEMVNTIFYKYSFIYLKRGFRNLKNIFTSPKNQKKKITKYHEKIRKQLSPSWGFRDSKSLDLSKAIKRKKSLNHMLPSVVEIMNPNRYFLKKPMFCGALLETFALRAP